MTTPLKFLFDECLGKPMMIKLLEPLPHPESLHFEHVCELFGSGARDAEWIPKIAAEGGWIIITTDGGRQSKREEKLPELCREHLISHILFTATLHNKKSHEKLSVLSLMWSQILEVHKEPPGTGFKLRYRQSKDQLSSIVVLEKIIRSG